MGDFKESSIKFADSAAVDAFARLRVSSPHNLFDGLQQYNTSPLFFEDVLTGAGTVTHLPNESSILLSTGTASGDKVVRQTREYFRYSPGKSQLILLSAVMGAAKTNVRQRLGYFDDQNGLFFEVTSAGLGVVQRSYTTGSVVDTRVNQSSFNVDKLDGTGVSGMSLDLSKDNLFVIDLEWLGAGRVRFGVFKNGSIKYCHYFLNENTNTTAYMTTANLPMRMELENTGTAASGTSFRNTCSTVITEDASEEKNGILITASNGTTPIAVTTRRAILSIRPKSTFNSIVNRATVKNVQIELLATTNNAFYEIVYNGTLGGTPSWTSVGTHSTVEYDIAGTTVTGGVVIDSGFITAGSGSKSAGTAVSNALSKLPFTLDVAGANPITLSVVVTSFSGTSNVSASLKWLELY